MSGNVGTSGPVKMLVRRLDMNFTIHPYIQRAARVGRDPRKRRDGQGAAARGAGRAAAPAGGARYGVPVIPAPLSLPGRTVIFDYGEVISLSQSQADRTLIARLAGAGDGAAADRFWAAYSAHRDGLDQGTAGVAAYWRAIARDIGARWDEARVSELWTADFRSWLSVDPAIVRLLADLRAGGTTLALLSNAGPDYGSFFRRGPLGDYFTACYVSGELGLLKPHPDIYRHVLGDLAITPAEAIFIDNRETNVAGARALGITGHVYTGAERLREFLAALAAPAASR
jgi:putative hydrolase of the HAD superfamily